MKLTIGRRLTQEVGSVEEASRIYCRLRDASGEGYSTFPEGRIRDGKKAYRVSYNGRVWTNETDRKSRTVVCEAQYEEANP